MTGPSGVAAFHSQVARAVIIESAPRRCYLAF